jgi:hypothetical protein
MNIELCCTCGATWRAQYVTIKESDAIQHQWDACHPLGVKDKWSGLLHSPCTSDQALENRRWFEEEERRQARKNNR